MRAHSLGPSSSTATAAMNRSPAAREATCSPPVGGSNSLDGGTGNDTLVSNLGDDSLFGGAGNDVFFINPGPDPLVNDTGGFNTLNFSIAALGITLDLSQNTGQTAGCRLEQDVVTLQGQFDGYVGSSAWRQDHGQLG